MDEAEHEALEGRDEERAEADGARDGPSGGTPMPQLSVVLPAHNEVTLLGSTVTNLVSGLEDRGLSYELVVVENGSRDGTLRLARILASQLAHVRVLALPYGDYGAALHTGFLAARGEIVASFDVDYYDLAFLDAGLEALATSDAAIVLASKRAPGASDRRPVARRLLTALFAELLRRVVALEVSDAHGMKLFRAQLLAPLLESCIMRESLLDVEMVLRAQRAGLVVAELPARVVERRAPRSSVTRRAAESLIGIVELRALLEREDRGEVPLDERSRSVRQLALLQARLAAASGGSRLAVAAKAIARRRTRRATPRRSR